MSLDKVAIALEFISYFCITPSIYGEENLLKLKNWVDNLFERVRSFKSKDLTSWLTDGEKRIYLFALLLVIWLFIAEIISEKWETGMWIVIICFGLSPLFLLMLAYCFKEENKRRQWITVSYKVQTLPVNILFYVLRFSMKVIEVVIDALISIPLWIFKIGKGNSGYIMLILGTFLFVSSKVISFILCD